MSVKILKIYHAIDGCGRKRVYADCRCFCGKRFSTRRESIVSKNTKSCGCLVDSARIIPKRKTRSYHGISDSPEHHAYFEMLSRCYNKNNSSYKHYGERGVFVCERWIESFANFIEDVGMRPTSKHSLDRIDVNGNYEKENCKWSTQSEQCRNRRNNRYVSYNGKDVLIVELADMFGINYKVLHRRITRGWDIERALHQKVQKKS